MNADSLWLEDEYAPRAALRGDVRCDVCVIGGGAGGAAVAWRLAGAGLDVVLVEAREVAGGASGRNGGFFLAGAAPMYDEMVRLWGRERARRIYAATLAAQLEMLDTADAIGARGHFRLTGLLRLGVDAAEAETVRSHHAALQADGFPGELVGAESLPQAVRRPDRLGLLTAHDGALHPARWVRALAGAAEQAGARVFEGTPATEPPAAGAAVRTPGGSVDAEYVVIAMDGGLAALAPGAARVRPRRLNMLATAPVADLILPHPIYARDGHEYAQQLPDGRIAVGGFSDVDGAAGWTDREVLSDPAQTRLDRYLIDELGVRAEVTHRWVGIVGYADDPLPTCGPADDAGRILAIGGYNGTGVVQSWVAARIAADLVIEGTSSDGDLYAPVS